eukprot:1348639-Amorphochlora_amoeboformis.AAC.1
MAVPRPTSDTKRLTIKFPISQNKLGTHRRPHDLKHPPSIVCTPRRSFQSDRLSSPWPSLTPATSHSTGRGIPISNFTSPINSTRVPTRIMSFMSGGGGGGGGNQRKDIIQIIADNQKQYIASLSCNIHITIGALVMTSPVQLYLMVAPMWGDPQMSLEASYKRSTGIFWLLTALTAPLGHGVLIYLARARRIRSTTQSYREG